MFDQRQHHRHQRSDHHGLVVGEPARSGEHHQGDHHEVHEGDRHQGEAGGRRRRPVPPADRSRRHVRHAARRDRRDLALARPPAQPAEARSTPTRGRRSSTNLGREHLRHSRPRADQDGDRSSAVPDSAAAQILVYRKDLFEKAGLQAAHDLRRHREGRADADRQRAYGITLATDPADVFTSQTFESLALGNDCQLVDSSGKITLDSPQCERPATCTATLATEVLAEGHPDRRHHPGHATSPASRRWSIWSTYLLDELGGPPQRRAAHLPAVQERPDVLAKNSGIVTASPGRTAGRAPAYGEITSWVVTKKAKTAASEKFVEYMMSTGTTTGSVWRPRASSRSDRRRERSDTTFIDAWANLTRASTPRSRCRDLRRRDDRAVHRSAGRDRAVGHHAGAGRPARRGDLATAGAAGGRRAAAPAAPRPTRRELERPSDAAASSCRRTPD